MIDQRTGTPPIPEPLRQSVLERLRQLGRHERIVVLCASVIGRRFDVGILTATLARPAALIRNALERACVLQLLEAEGGVPGRYVFRHALTRDIAYGELLAARTRLLHRRIARALEMAPDDVAIEEIAYHWWAAGDQRRGSRANELAGDRAAALYAAAMARIHYARALSLVTPGSRAHQRLDAKLRRTSECASAPGGSR